MSADSIIALGDAIGAERKAVDAVAEMYDELLNVHEDLITNKPAVAALHIPDKKQKEVVEEIRKGRAALAAIRAAR